MPHHSRSRAKNRHPQLAVPLLTLHPPAIDSRLKFPIHEGMRHHLVVSSFLVIAALTGLFPRPTTGNASEESPFEPIASLASGSPMMLVAEGPFLMGTARASYTPFSLDLPYDDTEQPQRRVWLDRFEIDRDEVSLGELLLWLQRQDHPIPEEMRKLIDHTRTVHAVPSETLARWPALYVTWAEASEFCLAQGKRLPTEAEWEKAARGDGGNLFPWGQSPPTPMLATFGQYHVHEIPIVAAVESGKEGRSPYGLHHMAGNVAEWVQDWFGIDYYVAMPDRNPRGPTSGRYKAVRGGSWKSAPALLRTATRGGASPDRRAVTIGFRCARSLP
ncbi:MAG: SUMF1/EgtB/PvdO family nonheme iron enzyme [Nitrospira sp.]|nr:SUMF1/EgtB/PvdO family nonheme iron enzyme [Nitrospira sp.]